MNTFGKACVVLADPCMTCSGTGTLTPPPTASGGYSSTPAVCPSCINGFRLSQVSITQFVQSIAAETITQLMGPERHKWYDSVVAGVEEKFKNIEEQILGQQAARQQGQLSPGDRVRALRDLVISATKVCIAMGVVGTVVTPFLQNQLGNTVPATVRFDLAGVSNTTAVWPDEVEKIHD